MIGIGLVIIAIGYAIDVWGIRSLQGKSQPNFVSYIFPFGKGSNFTLNSKGNPSNLNTGGKGIQGPITAADVAKLPNKVQTIIRPNPNPGRGD